MEEDNKSSMSTSTRRGKALDKHCLDEKCNGKKISGKNWGAHKKIKGHGADCKYKVCETTDACETCLKQGKF
jgi:hypothetical protein